MRAFTLLIVTFLFGGVAALPTPVSSASEEQALTTQPTSASSSPRELGSKKNKRRQKWATPSHSIAIPAFFHGDTPIDPKDGPDGVRGDPEDPDKENECANVDESKDTIYDGDDIPAATPDKSEVIDKVQQPIIDPPPCDPEKASPEKDSIVCPIKEEEVKVDEVFKSMEEHPELTVVIAKPIPRNAPKPDESTCTSLGLYDRKKDLRKMLALCSRKVSMEQPICIRKQGNDQELFVCGVGEKQDDPDAEDEPWEPEIDDKDEDCDPREQKDCDGKKRGALIYAYWRDSSFEEQVTDIQDEGSASPNLVTANIVKITYGTAHREMQLKGKANAAGDCGNGNGKNARQLEDNKDDKRRELEVVGTDTRVAVGPVASSPWNKAVRIVFAPVFDNQGQCSVRVCSGMWISRDTVSTAAHCLYDNGNWLDVRGVVMADDADSSTFPYCGSTSQMVAAGMFQRNWMRRRGSGAVGHDDVGFIETIVDHTTGYMSHGWQSMCPGYMLNTMGFPGDKGGDELWYSYHYGSTMWCVGGITWHFADTKPGQSGSAVYYKSGSTRINYQIHGGSTWIPFTTVNIAAKMDAAHFGSMCNFMDLYGSHCTCSSAYC